MVQEAFVVALDRWPRDGVPANPGAWIVTVARNRALDRLRRERRGGEKLAELARLLPAEDAPADAADAMDTIPDERLSLVFMCCHPALALEARVALTLRLLGGLTTGEIARAFLVPEATMAQRLVRAKRKIRAAGIPFRVPPAHVLPERLDSALAVLYLVFNEGYSTTAADTLVRRELTAEAIRLTRVLVTLMPDEAEAIGLLALMLLQDSRRHARVDANGELVLLEQQDRSLWDESEIEEGLALAERARRAGGGRYGLQAAIAAEHARARAPRETDWRRIAALYGELARLDPSPVVELNRAVAVALAESPEAGLALVDRIDGLDSYHLFHSARADLLQRVGRRAEAAEAYGRARELATNPVERRFLERRLAEVQDSRHG
jgi:RNA polymerase sigma-70 factor, ECF subfamily